MPTKKGSVKPVVTAKKLITTDSQNNVVEFAIARAHIMKNLLETLRYILTEANLVFTKDSVKITTCNSAENIFIFVCLRTSEADHYWMDPSAKEYIVGVEVFRLHKVLKTMNANDLLSLKVHRHNPKEFSIESYSAGDTTCKNHFTFSPFDITQDIITLKPVEYNTKLQINASRLQKAVRDLENLGVEWVQIQSVDNTIRIKSFQGGVVAQCTTFEGVRVKNDDMSDDDFRVVESKQSEVYSAVFHLKSLTYCTRSTALSETINIYLQNNIPLLLEYPVGSFGYLRALLFETENPPVPAST